MHLRTSSEWHLSILTCLAVKTACLSGKRESLIVNNTQPHVSNRKLHLRLGRILLINPCNIKVLCLTIRHIQSIGLFAAKESIYAETLVFRRK